MGATRVLAVLVLLAILISLTSACGPTPNPQVVEKTVKETVVVEVEKEVEVKETVVVEVEKEVKETVVVEVGKETAYEGKPRFLFTLPTIHAYLDQVHEGSDAAADELGWELYWRSPSTYNPEKQVEMTESGLSLPGVAGVSVITGNPQMFEGVLGDAKSMGLSVTANGACDDMVGGAYCDVCMSTDHRAAAGQICAHLAELMGGEGKIVIGCGEPGDLVMVNRAEGCMEEIEANWPNIEVLDWLKGCDDPVGTTACAENALSTYPEMTAYYGCGFYSALGASAAFPQAGRTDILITGVDDGPEIIDAIRNGTVTFTYVQQPYGQGYLPIYISHLMMTEGLEPVGEGCYFLDTGITIVDQSNVDTYKDVMKENLQVLLEKVKNEVLK
jgi:ribose transport system substrate-binding protein